MYGIVINMWHHFDIDYVVPNDFLTRDAQNVELLCPLLNLRNVA